MQGFAHRTGIDAEAPQQRYLWTDALAVENLLSLAHATGERHYVELAVHLVDLVHHTLGRHRDDDWRSGWLSGLSELGAASHPTWGGLRIGKPLPERKWDEPLDETLEWERDGQYFHYLTRWMRALDSLARYTNDGRYNRWARELAAVAFAAFTMEAPTDGGRTARRLVWKMSIDLSRPLVATQGKHDALEGLITCGQLQATAAHLARQGLADEGPSLEEERAGFEEMTRFDGAWSTADPLGLGELLSDAWRVRQLETEGRGFEHPLLTRLLSSALEGMAQFASANGLGRPALARLPFRELGLAIGLHTLQRLSEEATLPSADVELLEAMRPALELGSEIDAYWLEPGHRTSSSWLEHRELNEVTLAASLLAAEQH